MLGALTTGALAAVGAGLIGGEIDVTAQATAVVGVVAALFRVLRQVHHKSARLDPVDCLILIALKSRRDGLEAGEVRSVLTAVGHELDQEEVDRRLAALLRVQLRDGTTTGFASLSGRDRWSAAGL